jgi:hypothetical protein
MCIIQKARGEAPTEAAFHGDAVRQPPALVTTLPRVRRIPSSADEERELLVELTTGALVAVVTVLACPYVLWQNARYPALVSKHGPLAVAGTFGGHLHAIALIERTVDGFAALDPYFPAHAPLQIDDDAFASFFGGHAYVADP